ncbi:MAG: acetylglutamate kinase [Candidatus Howiella sp.]|jgi:hypothetical protein
MRDAYTPRQVCLMNQFRRLWEQHVYWTRFFIISTAADLGDLEPVTNRLLRNPADFAASLTPFYGVKASACFKELFTQHLLIAADLVNAAKAQQTQKAEDARKAWYANAEKIAQFLAGINPCWNLENWRDMLYSHLSMTEKEAVLRLSGKYTEDIRIFECIEDEALKMADYMSNGIIQQFCVC